MSDFKDRYKYEDRYCLFGGFEAIVHCSESLWLSFYHEKLSILSIDEYDEGYEIGTLNKDEQRALYLELKEYYKKLGME